MINRISIKNFKSLNVDVELDPVTVLVGRSGTGKSNFVKAVRFLRRVLAGEIGNNDVREFQIFPFDKNRQKTTLEYKIHFSVPSLNDTFVYEIKLASSDGFTVGITEEILTVSGKTFFHRGVNKVDAAPEVPAMVLSIAPPFSMLSQISGSQQISVAYIALTKGLACYDFPGNVCGDRDEDSKKHDPNLTDGAENYIGVFDTIREDLHNFSSWDAINKSLRTLNSSFRIVDIQKFGTESSIFVVVSHELNGKTLTFSITQESEGFRRFFAHLLALYQSPPKQTMLFEEPERGIHPAAMETLADALKRCPEEGRGQVILTTHSPELLDHFEPESIRAVEIHDGETRIGRISKEQLEAVREFLYRPGQLLTDEDARIDETECEPVSVTEI